MQFTIIFTLARTLFGKHKLISTPTASAGPEILFSEMPRRPANFWWRLPGIDQGDHISRRLSSLTITTCYRPIRTTKQRILCSTVISPIHQLQLVASNIYFSHYRSSSITMSVQDKAQHTISQIDKEVSLGFNAQRCLHITCMRVVDLYDIFVI